MAVNTEIWNPTRVDQESVIPELNLLFAQFPGDEYVHVEAEKDGFSLMWSGKTNIKETILLSHDILPKYTGSNDCTSRIKLKNGEEFDDVDTRHAEQMVLGSAAARFAYFEGGYTESIIAWRSPQIKMKTDTMPHIEISLNARNVDLPRIVRFIGRTGTGRISEALQRSTQPLSSALEY